ncbi:extracellular solute-binding protein [Pseudactinotalea sp.]|uniref:extracellular solute-binding protein n=1 Tax=Pseudactinotalea sp. TaxID=1926260 RepID=UPI003B3B15AB
MSTQRTRLVVALGLVTALTLTACGRSDSPAGSGGGATDAEEFSSTDLQGEIEMWAMGAEGEKLPVLAEAFMAEHPGTTVNVTAIPWDAAYDKFANAITAGTTPDVAMIGSTWSGDFAAQGALEPLPESFDTSGFFEGAVGTTLVDDVAYAVPWYVETRMVYYRTDIAEAAGYPEAPTDWEGFQAMAVAMQEQPEVDWGLNLQPGGEGSWQSVLPLAWSAGAVTDDAEGYQFDSPEVLQAVEYFQSFFADGISDPNPPEGQTEADFTSGRIPMFISGPWMMSLVEDMGGDGFADTYDVAPIPSPDGSTSRSFVGGSNLGVFTTTENRDLAWTWVQYLSDPATQVEWYGQTSALPAVQSAWDDPALSDDPKLAAFGVQLETALAPASYSSWTQVAATFDGEMEKVAKTDADPAASLATVQQTADELGTGLD